MEVDEALARLKFLVNHDRFYMVQRQNRMAMPVSVTLAKEIVRQLSINDFVKHEPNRNNPLQFVWVFKTSDGQTYYIKFVFTENNQKVVFISFHLDYERRRFIWLTKRTLQLLIPSTDMSTR